VAHWPHRWHRQTELENVRLQTFLLIKPSITPCHSYVCHIDPASLVSASVTSTSPQTVFAIPTSPLLPRIRLRTRQAPTLLNQKVLVTVDRWDQNSRYPEGHFVRALGKVGGKEAEQEALLVEFGVTYGAFGKAIVDCLPAEGDAWVVPSKAEGAEIWKGREDLRELLVCSIDPPGELLLASWSD